MGSISVALKSAGARVHSWSRVYSGTLGRRMPEEKSIETTHASTEIETRMITIIPMGTTQSSTVSLSTSDPSAGASGPRVRTACPV